MVRSSYSHPFRPSRTVPALISRCSYGQRNVGALRRLRCVNSGDGAASARHFWAGSDANFEKVTPTEWTAVNTGSHRPNRHCTLIEQRAVYDADQRRGVAWSAV